MTEPRTGHTRIRVHGAVAHHTLCARRPNPDLVFGAVARGPGGAGGAVALQVARLGGRICLTAGIGTDATGDELVRGLTADGVDCGAVVRGGTSTKIVVVVEDGVELTCDLGSEITPDAWPVTADGTIDWLSGFPPMAEVIRGTQRVGDQPVVDLGYAPWGSDAGALLNHAVPLAPYIGTAVVSGGRLGDGDVADVAGQLCRAGCARVIATRAERGVDVFDECGRRHFEAHSVEQVDPLCAGDAFIAGYLEALSRGLDVAAAVQRGQDVAACKIGMFGEFPTAAQVDAWLRCGRR
jgi:sugar/nucleoside kinase (ribokinase family)